MLSIKKVKSRERRKMEVTVPPRRRISTVTGYDLQKAHRKAQAIQQSKQQGHGGSHGGDSGGGSASGSGIGEQKKK